MIVRRDGRSRLRRWARRAPGPASRLGLDLGRHRPDVDQYGGSSTTGVGTDRLFGPGAAVGGSLAELAGRLRSSPVATSCAVCGYAWTRKVKLPGPTERSNVW